MPHCIIEYTRDLEDKIDIKEVMEVAYKSIEQSALFNNTAIKARAVALDHYKSGLESNDYIHISLKILPGRNAEQKAMLSKLVLDNVVAIVGNTRSTSVEIIDLDGESYIKHINSGDP